ncbi:MAG: cyclic nucleotide-binding domain-containing protein [Planctomycetes bacterium]|nr:cyclic nucleotide-binding domain-containing protein [Planctomycetota bacterium]
MNLPLERSADDPLLLQNRDLQRQLDEISVSIENAEESLSRLTEINAALKEENRNLLTALKGSEEKGAELRRDKEGEIAEYKKKLEHFFRLVESDPSLEPKGVKEALKPIAIAANTVLFEQGETSDGFYILKSGRVGIYRDGHQVNDISGENKYFGEMIIIGEKARTAAAVALEACMVIKIPTEQYINVLKSKPSMMLDLLIGNTRRLAVRTEEYALVKEKLVRIKAILEKKVRPENIVKEISSAIEE